LFHSIAAETLETRPTSALGHKQKFRTAIAMSAFADIPGGGQHACFVPKADIHGLTCGKGKTASRPSLRIHIRLF
jgi:hypothetical protein